MTFNRNDRFLKSLSSKRTWRTLEKNVKLSKLQKLTKGWQNSKGLLFRKRLNLGRKSNLRDFSTFNNFHLPYYSPPSPQLRRSLENQQPCNQGGKQQPRKVPRHSLHWDEPDLTHCGWRAFPGGGHQKQSGQLISVSVAWSGDKSRVNMKLAQNIKEKAGEWYVHRGFEELSHTPRNLKGPMHGAQGGVQAQQTSLKARSSHLWLTLTLSASKNRRLRQSCKEPGWVLQMCPSM